MRHAVLGSIATLLVATMATAAPGGPIQTGVIKPGDNSMVKPGTAVDPGMKVIRPKAPAATPVIKPKPTTPDGSVVVPR